MQRPPVLGRYDSESQRRVDVIVRCRCPTNQRSLRLDHCQIHRMTSTSESWLMSHANPTSQGAARVMRCSTTPVAHTCRRQLIVQHAGELNQVSRISRRHEYILLKTLMVYAGMRVCASGGPDLRTGRCARETIEPGMSGQCKLDDLIQTLPGRSFRDRSRTLGIFDLSWPHSSRCHTSSHA